MLLCLKKEILQQRKNKKKMFIAFCGIQHPCPDSPHPNDVPNMHLLFIVLRTYLTALMRA